MSKIEWTEETWNPTVGCDKVSAGCTECYAIRMAWRLMHSPHKSISDKYKGTVEKTAGGRLNWTGQINILHDVLKKPLLQKKPTVYFVDSMSDLFHEKIPFEFIGKVFTVMALCPQHRFQILTKRVERAIEYFERYENGLVDVPIEENAIEFGELLYDKNHQLHSYLKDAGWMWDITYDDDGEGGVTKDSSLEYFGDLPLKNVWIGVSDEGNQHGRIDYLRKIPAAVRFISGEPLVFDPGIMNLDSIDWVICGGESGPGKRPMNLDWARSLRDQCKKADVAFFMKQVDKVQPIPDDLMIREFPE